MPAQNNRPDATDFVYTFTYSPNVKRDGTMLDSNDFVSSNWMRFQRGRPRKMGGYRRTFLTPRGIPRQLITQTIDGVAYLFVGSDAGIDAFTASSSFADGAGPFPVTILNTYGQQTILSQTGNTFTVAGNTTALYPPGGRVVFGGETSTNLFYIASSTFTPSTTSPSTTVTIGQSLISAAIATGGANYNIGDVLTIAGGTTPDFATQLAVTTVTAVGAITGIISGVSIVRAGVYTTPPTSPANGTGGGGTGATFTLTFGSSAIPPSQTLVWRYLDSPYAFDPTQAARLWKFDVLWNQQKTQGQLLAHGGLNLDSVDSARVAPTWYGNFIAQQFSWTMRPLADTAGQTPSYQPILVDGGVLALYPFILCYGSNGAVRINNVNQLRAQQSFEDWNGALAQDANYGGTKVIATATVRGGQNSPSALLFTADGLVRLSFQPNAVANGQVWVPDLIASKISIMSANCVAQTGSEYYWMGVDAFYRYNGTVQSIPNTKNINYVFDNLNFNQRQKVWALPVPRYREIWWFYPAGTATECNRAVIHYTGNGADSPPAWYDAGEGIDFTGIDGAKRCAGYVTEAFPRPFCCAYTPSNDIGAPQMVVSPPVTVPPLPAPTATSFYIAGDATPIFAPGFYVSLTASNDLNLPVITNSQYFASVGTGQAAVFANVTLVTISAPLSLNPTPGPLPIGTAVYPATASGYAVWEHEIESYNKIEGTRVSSIYSSFETNDLSWISGQVGQPAPRGDNVQIRVRRFEPDFTQVGDMRLTFIRRRFARSPQLPDVSFTFTPTTERVDTLGAQGRLLRMRFESDDIDGFYEMGKCLMQVAYEDQTP